MSQRVFKHKNGYYIGGSYFTGTLKNTKKACRDEMKENYAYDGYNGYPAQDTPRIISKTYDTIKSFLNEYLTETRKLQIISTTDYCEHLYSSRCELRIVNNSGQTIASSNNYCSYDIRRRICLEFFNDVKGINPEYDKFYDVHYKEIYEGENKGFDIEELKRKYKDYIPTETTNE